MAFALARETVREVDLHDAGEAARIEEFVANSGGAVFHRPAWLLAVEQGTGQFARGLVSEKNAQITGWLPLTEVHSPIFGRALASSGFAVEGGILGAAQGAGDLLCRAAQELAAKLSCTTIELRGGHAAPDWSATTDSHCGFVIPLAEDDEAQLTAIPRKQRAEVRKSLALGLDIRTGRLAEDRDAHYRVYAQSVHNLGTPVFPRSLFDAAMDLLDTDILTVRHQGQPVASVLSFYHGGAVLPYWGGGTWDARRLRANDAMYYALMCHARTRGCDRFDFGRSKTGSGAYHFKKNWGFAPDPLSYASWTVPGHVPRDANPNSEQHQARIALWKKLPLPIANRLGPLIARGLG